MAETTPEWHLRRVLRKSKDAQEKYAALDDRAKIAILHHWQSGYRKLYDEVLAAVGDEFRTNVILHTLLTECLNQTFKEVRQLLDAAGYYEGRKQQEADLAASLRARRSDPQ